MKIVTDRFHGIKISKTYSMRFMERDTTLANLLNYYFTYACNKYRTQGEMSDLLSDRYKSRYSQKINTIGTFLEYDMEMYFIDPKYINDDSYTIDNQIELFNDLSTPYTRGGHFVKKIFNLAKKAYKMGLKENISDIANASRNLIKYLFDGTIRNFEQAGSLSILETITIEELEDFYNRLISSMSLSYLAGDVENYKFNSNDTLIPYTKQPNLCFKERAKLENDIIFDEHKSKLGILSVVYDLNTYITEPDYDTANFFNYWLGSSDYNKLFEIVREKYNLCYSISSSYLGASGMLIITSRIKKNDLNKCLDAIKEVFDTYFDNFDLEERKKLYLIDNKTIYDSIPSLISKHFTDTYCSYLSDDREIEAIKSLTLNDVKRIKDKCNKPYLIHLYGGDLYE